MDNWEDWDNVDEPIQAIKNLQLLQERKLVEQSEIQLIQQLLKNESDINLERDLERDLEREKPKDKVKCKKPIKEKPIRLKKEVPKEKSKQNLKQKEIFGEAETLDLYSELEDKLLSRL